MAAFCAAALPAAHTFSVRPGRDTVLLGRQGTLLAIPADAWQQPTQGRLPLVQLELREFYSTSDIVLAGLSTASGPNLLETGGMVHLMATAGGQPVALRPDRRLLLRLPTATKAPDMRLYQGSVSAQLAHAVDWQLPPTTAPTSTFQLSGQGWEALLEQEILPDAKPEHITFDLDKGGRWPQLPGGREALPRFFDKQVPYSAATHKRLRQHRDIGPAEKRLLQKLSKSNHRKVLRAICVRLEVDSVGRLAAAELLPDGDAEIGAAVLAAVRQLPAWRPARFRRLSAPHWAERAGAVGVLAVLYTSSGQRLVGMSWDNEITHLPRIQQYLAALEIPLRREKQRQFAAQFARAGPLALDDKLYYELAAGGLGWINCDRLLEAGPRIEYAVQTPQPATVVTLVFQKQRSILSGEQTASAATVFAQVPEGAPATVVALRRENGVTYLATALTTLSAGSQPTLTYRLVSLEELRSALAKL